MLRIGVIFPALLVAVAASVTGGAADGQRPQATFRSEVSYVEVDVIVTDAAGNFVPGLTAADFELLEDGRPQAIEAFNEVDVPVQRAGAPLNVRTAVHPDVVSNEATAEGRIYLLVLDDLHTRPSNTARVRKRAREFVEGYVGANDLAAVLHTSGRADASQDFTSNRALLLASIDAFMGRGLNSAVLNRIEYVLSGASGPPRDLDAPERLNVARGLFLTVRNLAEYLGSLTGRRKAMLLFSEGLDLASEGDAGIGSAGSFSEMQDAGAAMHEAIAIATRANVHVYAIDASGMAAAGAGAEIRVMLTEPGLNLESLERERRSMLGTLRTIADGTGGAALVNTNNLDEGFARIHRENSRYYLLGYYPQARRDGKFHALTVRVTRAGLRVRARAGYYAAKASDAAATSGADPLAAMLAAAVPAAGLPMRLAAPVFRHTRAEARAWVAVDLPPDVFRFYAAGGVASENLRVAWQAIDPAAKVAASDAQDLQLRLRPETRGQVEQRGFRVVFPVDVPAGRYQLRVAARTENAARQGSVFADLQVPDFWTGELAWSGVSMTSLAAVGVPTRPADVEAAKTFPLLPAAVRAFAAGDRLGVYAEVYDGGSGPTGRVDLSAVVRDQTGRVVFSTSEDRSRADLRAATGGHGFRAEIPLTGFAPGSYVLTLRAAPRASSGAAVTRDIPFAIGIS